MKALRFQKFGQQDLKLEDVPRPQPGPGEVLVKVRAASINPSDIKNVEGMMRETTTLPRIPGRDFAGLVEEGWDGEENLEIWGCGGELGFNRDGSHAEYVVVPKQAVVPKPANLNFEQSAAAALGIVTAWAAIFDRGELKKGQTLLVLGANGTVGTAAVQLGAWAGARVIGVDLTSHNRSGADVMLSSESPSLDQELKAAAGAGVNVALDAVGGPMFDRAVSALGHCGRVVVITARGDHHARLNLLDFYRHDLHLIGLNTLNLSAEEAGMILQEATRPFELGWLKPREVITHPLSDGINAYQQAAKGGVKHVLMNS